MSYPFDLWTAPEDFDATEYAAMLGELRDFLSVVATSAPGPDQVRTLTSQLHAMRQGLTPFVTDDDRAPYGQQLDLEGDHGLVSLPSIEVLDVSDGHLEAEVRFSRWHVGGGGTVHGGMVATALDELMGHAQLSAGWIARTAYLNVSFRAGTPFDRTLRASVRTVRAEGRKQVVAATLLDGELLLAEAEALFVRVSPYPAASATSEAQTSEAR